MIFGIEFSPFLVPRPGSWRITVFEHNRNGNISVSTEVVDIAGRNKKFCDLKTCEYYLTLT